MARIDPGPPPFDDARGSGQAGPFVEPGTTPRELFSPLVFKILVGNIDDHARNHAAFRDCTALALTPAHDICPQRRTGGEASQAMLIRGNDRRSRIATCLDPAARNQLGDEAARPIVAHQVSTIRDR